MLSIIGIILGILLILSNGIEYIFWKYHNKHLTDYFGNYEIEKEHKTVSCGCFVVLDIILIAIIVIILFV
jgi:hypothetical protein